MRIHILPHHDVRRSLKFFLLAAAIVVTAVAPAQAQDAAEYAVQPESKLWVDGTSNQSDWTVHAADLSGRFAVTGSGSDVGVASGEFQVESKTMEGGKSTIMDRLMRDALMVDEHPTISYELTSAERAASPADDGSITLNTTGSLTLTGTTNDITMVVTGTPTDDGKIRFKGSHPLKMSDYGMEPPTAMFGALRTGDDVTVHFDVVVAPAQ